MTLKTNCGDNASCGCQAPPNAHSRMALRANLLEGSYHTTFQGHDTLVVPVIMIRSEVVMNGTYVPADELAPVAWNGVPVTINHPEVKEGFTSANSPEVIEKWGIGTIYNTRWDAGALKGEAWIDVEKAEALRPGLVAQLEEGDQMDVSTGFFSVDENKSGQSNGRTFERIARQINPDHLALLPGGTGACSWEDGCGVRANRQEAPSMAENEEDTIKLSALERVLKAMGINVPATNKRGEDDDYRQVIADLISNDASPFGPDDQESLMYMSYETLISMRDQFIPTAGGDDDVNANQEQGGPAVADKDAKEGKAAEPMTAEQITELVTNAVAEALKTNSAAAPAALSDEDRAALDRAKEIVANDRAERVAKIVANSEITKEAAEAMDDATLAVVANGIREAAPDYSGAGGFVNVNAAEKDDKAVVAMVPPSSRSFLDARSKKELN